VELSRYRYIRPAPIPWRVPVANGVPDVLAAARAQQRERVKLAGGGVISTSIPLMLRNIRPRVAGRCTSGDDWGTVAIHAYTPNAIRAAAGIKSEHGHLADEATVRLIAQRRAWLSTQPGDQATLKPAPGQEKRKPLIGAWERLLLGQTITPKSPEPTFVRPNGTY